MSEQEQTEGLSIWLGSAINALKWIAEGTRDGRPCFDNGEDIHSFVKTSASMLKAEMNGMLSGRRGGMSEDQNTGRLTDAERDAIWDRYQDAPTLEFRSLVTAALESAVLARAQGEAVSAGFWLDAQYINSIVVASLKDLIRRAKQCSICDVDLRENGKNVRFEADWVKYMEWLPATPTPGAASDAVRVGLVLDNAIEALVDGGPGTKAYVLEKLRKARAALATTPSAQPPKESE